MTNVIFFLFSALFTFLLTPTPASAYRPPSPCGEVYTADWGGFYLSGQLGMGMNREHLEFENLNYFNTLGPIALGTRFNHKSQGFVGGGALGCNYQTGSFVIGLEGGIVSSNLKKTHPSPFFPAVDRFSSSLQCISTGKLRLGYAYDSLLTFITGGWAGGNHVLKLKDTSSDVSSHLKKWVNGWTIGIGFDCKWADCFSLGLAYDYAQLKYHHKNASCPNCGIGVGLGSPLVGNHLDVQTLTLRLNYFFSL